MTFQGVPIFDFVGAITIAVITVVVLLVSSKPKERTK